MRSLRWKLLHKLIQVSPLVQTATAQIAVAVLVSAILAPLLAAWVLKHQGGFVE